MTIFANDAGTIRTLSSIYYNDDGTIRQLTDIYYNDAGTIRQLLASTVVMFTYDWTISGMGNAITTAIAEIQALEYTGTRSNVIATGSGTNEIVTISFQDNFDSGNAVSETTVELGTFSEFTHDQALDSWPTDAMTPTNTDWTYTPGDGTSGTFTYVGTDPLLTERLSVSVNVTFTDAPATGTQPGLRANVGTALSSINAPAPVRLFTNDVVTFSDSQVTSSTPRLLESGDTIEFFFLSEQWCTKTV